MTSTKSTHGRARAEPGRAGVSGFSTMPGHLPFGADRRAPCARRRRPRRGRETQSAPGVAERLHVLRRGRVIIRWQSSVALVALRMLFTSGGPKVMFGTKWPSMTSRWSRSAPAGHHALRSRPRGSRSRPTGSTGRSGPGGWSGRRTGRRPWRAPGLAAQRIRRGARAAGATRRCRTRVNRGTGGGGGRRRIRGRGGMDPAPVRDPEALAHRSRPGGPDCDAARLGRGHPLEELDAAGAVAPLVVVPGAAPSRGCR